MLEYCGDFVSFLYWKWINVKKGLLAAICSENLFKIRCNYCQKLLFWTTGIWFCLVCYKAPSEMSDVWWFSDNIFETKELIQLMLLLHYPALHTQTQFLVQLRKLQINCNAFGLMISIWTNQTPLRQFSLNNITSLENNCENQMKYTLNKCAKHMTIATVWKILEVWMM